MRWTRDNVCISMHNLAQADKRKGLRADEAPKAFAENLIVLARYFTLAPHAD
jgi:hypothetical protein